MIRIDTTGCIVSNWYKWTLSILLLSVGIGIYILFRPQNLLVFGLLDDLGLIPIVDSLRMSASVIMLPSFVINCVPAGLWTASYLIGMYLITTGASRTQKILLSSINEKCARIRKVFAGVLPSSVARYYSISGKRGEPKKISLPRDLVIWETD